MKAIMAVLRSGIAPSVVHSMVDVAATALRVTAPTPASPPRPRTLPADTLHPPHQPRQSSRQQPAPSDSPQHKAQDRQGSHQEAAASGPAEPQRPAQVMGSTSGAAADQPAAMPDAPYSFRRHRRMDLQPPQTQAASTQPTPSLVPPPTTHQVSASPRLKVKHQPSAETPLEATPEVAATAAAEPVRTSVRVKLRRTASATQQPASSGAVPGQQMTHGRRGRTYRHQRADVAQPAEGDEVVPSDAAVPGSRMQGSSGAHSGWHSDEDHLQPQDQQLEEADSARAVVGQTHADAASGPTTSQEQPEQEADYLDAFDSGTEGLLRDEAAGNGLSDDMDALDAMTDTDGLHGGNLLAGQ